MLRKGYAWLSPYQWKKKQLNNLESEDCLGIVSEKLVERKRTPGHINSYNPIHFFIMYYVYIIKSQLIPDKFYVGYTLDIKSRLQTHNSGSSIYTADYKPWELVWFCAFLDKARAQDFERYLKSHSGRAFMKKRLN